MAGDSNFSNLGKKDFDAMSLRLSCELRNSAYVRLDSLLWPDRYRSQSRRSEQSSGQRTYRLANKAIECRSVHSGEGGGETRGIRQVLPVGVRAAYR